MKMVESKFTIIDKIMNLENMSYMCANCRHEGILHVENFFYEMKENKLGVINSCPFCGEQRTYSFEMSKYERQNIAILVMRMNQKLNKDAIWTTNKKRL